MKNQKPMAFKATDLPPGLRPFWLTAPAKFRLAAVLVALVCYCVLGTRLRARYVYDTELHALLLQLLILGEPSSGKGFTRVIMKQLMSLLEQKDEEQMRMEQAYQELKKITAKNKNLPEEPITCVRMHTTITRAKLVKRFDLSKRKYGDIVSLFFFSEELATMTDNNKRAFADMNTTDRLAYDQGSFSSDALGEQCHNAKITVAYSSLFCCTQRALNEYITPKAIDGGNSTRKMLIEVDDSQLGEEAPVFRPQTEAEKAEIESTVKKLMDETYTADDKLQPIHIVPMEWMDGHIKKWCDAQRNEILKSGSKAHNCFYKRSSVSAFRMAVMLYHLWGETPEARPKVIRFYRFMAQYILDGQLKQWGATYEKLQKGKKVKDEKKVSLYEQLPDTFSRDQLYELCNTLNLSSGRIFLGKWKAKKFIVQPDPEKEVFVKNKDKKS